MNRSSQRGVALVITLIMLSVVTITAVAFLAVARRERGSVGAAAELVDARSASESALARAEAEVAARILGTGNRMDIRLQVSTNYVNTQVNLAQLDQMVTETLPTVDYRIFTNSSPQVRADGSPWFNQNTTAGLQHSRAALANLYYDPRPPVYAAISRSPNVRAEFRYYLDLNRNGICDTNGVQLMYDQSRKVIGTNTLVGDPEWVGETEYPGVPHSGTNRFQKRWAFVILPAGRTLDLNYLHNDVKDRRTVPGGYARNQGVGTFEDNGAAFLVDLNTNVWPTTSYTYRPASGALSSGLAFEDAYRLFLARRGDPQQTVQRGAPDFFEMSPKLMPFGNNHIDDYADGPIPATLAEFRRPQDYINSNQGEDSLKGRWAGTDNQRQILNLSGLLDGSVGTDLAARLAGRTNFAGNKLVSTYDQNTFYRMLGSLGTDTGDGRYESGTNYSGAFYRRAKLNINYAPDNNDPTVDLASSADISFFNDWKPIAWFTNAVHRLLLTEFTNGLPDRQLLTNSRTAHLGHGLAIHGTNVIRGVTNIYRYDAEVHRLLQVAANIYDATHYVSTARPGNPRGDIPSVFRPILYQQQTNGGLLVRIAGFQEVTNAVPLGRPWVDLDDNRQAARLSSNPDVAAILAAGLDFNAAGIPWVVGAKRGLPNFQEGYWQSRLDITRRLNITKALPTDALAKTNGRPWEDGRFGAFAQYRYDVANTFGMEAWNSYFTLSNPTAVTLRATNYFGFAIRDEASGLYGQAIYQTNGFKTAFATIAAGKWSPQEYLAPLNVGFGTNFVYDHIKKQIWPAGSTNGGYVDIRAPAPRLTIAFTNHLVYALIDQSGRLLDMVNLKSVMYQTNALGVLSKPAGTPSTGHHMSEFWNTNLYAGVGLYLSQGIALQFDGSLGSNQKGGVVDIQNSLWKEAPGVRPAGQQKDYEKDGLYYFLFRLPRRAGEKVASDVLAHFGGTATQVGYTPTATVLLTDRRQANDPLVHYTPEDLAPGLLLHTAPEGYTEVQVPGQFTLRSTAGSSFTVEERSLTNHLGNQAKVVRAYAPWGVNSDLGSGVPVPVNDIKSTAFDVAYKDSLVKRSDDWNFPTNKVPGIGWLGRIHRGTPWQTIYLKGLRPELGSTLVADRYLGAKSWAGWSGNGRTMPNNDWAILDLFTAAVNDNSARGVLGVNQTNLAAWSAVLSGMPVLTNVTGKPNGALSTRFIEPATPQLRRIVENINSSRTGFAGGVFSRLGQVLSASALSVGPLGTNQASPVFSPFLTPFDRYQIPGSATFVPAAVPDEVIEQIPQQVLSLLRTDEARVVIYAYGQALKPAPNSIVTRPGPFFGLCTNYVVTSEFATRTVVRFDGAPRPGQLRAVIEDHRVLPPEN